MKHRNERPTLQSVIARARAAWTARLAVGGTALAVAVGAVTFGVGALVVGAVAADVGISHGWFKSPQSESAAVADHQHDDTKDQSSADDRSASHQPDRQQQKPSQETQVGSDIDSWGDPEADNVIDFDDVFGSASGDAGQTGGSSGTSVQQGNGDESSQGGDWTNAYK